MSRIRLLNAALMLLLISAPLTSLAAPPGNEHFERTWERTERPVSDQATSRTWMWGPSASTGPITEPYMESPGGYREVQYFDKTRMEINNPLADPEDAWFVTNGLLAKELITGRVQTGNLTHVEIEPSRSQIAGDQHPDSPTYAALAQFLEDSPRPEGTVIADQLSIDSEVSKISEVLELAQYEVVADYHVPETDHTVAAPFWEFMNSSGLVHENGVNVHGRLFDDPFFATGFPISEAYWVHVPVGGEFKDVLLQCFERRCLTYTPANPDGWQVEAGNIGQHYHQFRYGRSPVELDCVELNLATIYQLVQITNIGESRAQTIMDHRPFESIEDLERVPGIGPATIEQIQQQDIACVVYDFNEEREFYK